jgi:1-acyl-sn-glycerol-3-phosphate acyltransferase
MNLFKKLTGKIFAFWALLVFILTMFLVLLPIIIIGLWPEPKRSHLFHPITEFWMKIFFTLSGVRRVFKGRENIKKNETYIIVCNHRSFLDPPLSTPSIPYPNKTIAKIEMAKIPLFGIVYKRGSVLVNRKSEESRKQSYAKMKEVLAMGLHMCIYPEGTRNRTTEPLQKFHDGAFKLAVETGKKIIPSLLFNTSNIFPAKGIFFWPGKVEMHFLPAIEVANKTTQELKEEVFEIMKVYYLKVESLEIKV